ncbi:cyclic GMP-AMP synthase [Siphateles boraxobius]|uniref:cyclic GMP-AMP synthase n=1 Tax=Siphateles boraxobius TaxID=180520 RepID=UPI0040645CB5
MQQKPSFNAKLRASPSVATPVIMSSQSRQSRVPAPSPDQHKAPAKANKKKSKEQSDHQTNDMEQSPGGESKKRQSKDNDPRETPTPSGGTGSINRQSKKRELVRVSPSLEISESKSEEKPSACKIYSVPNKANNAGENDRQDSAKSKPQQTAKSKYGEKTAPTRQNKKQGEPSKLGRGESLESSESKSQEKSVAKPIRRHESAPERDFSDPSHLDAPPGLSARSSDRKKKSAEKTPAMRGPSVDDTLGKVLKTTIEKLKIKKFERSNASSCVNDITDKVIAHLKQNTTWCTDIERLRTGSYYENVKICEPDEFDVMLTIPVERVDLEQFDKAGAFYSVALKRHPNRHPLDIFLNEDKTIQASKMLSEFRDAVKEAVEKLQYRIVIQRKKARCPAVTLEVTEYGKTISIDFVLGLKVHRASWPDFTKDGFKIDNWLGKKEKADMKRQPFYLVPKYVGKGDAEHDGVVAKDAWRISFSHVEKEILQRHGHSKTCCEAVGEKCCRKECLKLLKYLLQQLKEDDSKSNKMSNFCSYHAKTTLLHACTKRGNDSEWAYSQLADCFQQLLEDFVKHLRDRHLPNFFIPSHNLLHQATPSSCDFLAKSIENQRNNNFPIFS